MMQPKHVRILLYHYLMMLLKKFQLFLTCEEALREFKMVVPYKLLTASLLRIQLLSTMQNMLEDMLKLSIN